VSVGFDRFDERYVGWAVSTALHLALLLALATALGHGHRHHPDEPPARLVYVEPAPPAAPALGGGPSAPSVEEPVPPAATRSEPRAQAQRTLVRQPRTAPPRKPAEPVRAPVPAPPAAPAGPGDAQGAAGGRGDTLGGVADGLAGGVVGGRGDAPLALRDVASAPELVERVLPEYPARARALEIEGQVVLEVVLDRAGKVEEPVRVVRSIPLLDPAAVAAVKRWRFRPARDREGRTVRVLMEVPVRFVLR
jgi:protein TonB